MFVTIKLIVIFIQMYCENDFKKNFTFLPEGSRKALLL